MSVPMCLPISVCHRLRPPVPTVPPSHDCCALTRRAAVCDLRRMSNAALIVGFLPNAAKFSASRAKEREQRQAADRTWKLAAAIQSVPQLAASRFSSTNHVTGVNTHHRSTRWSTCCPTERPILTTQCLVRRACWARLKSTFSARHRALGRVLLASAARSPLLCRSSALLAIFVSGATIRKLELPNGMSRPYCPTPLSARVVSPHFFSKNGTPYADARPQSNNYT